LTPPANDAMPIFSMLCPRYRERTFLNREGFGRGVKT
jgi:hypothetical protein